MPTTIHQEIAQWLQTGCSNSNATGRPWVTLCYAQGWDGSLAIRPGQPLALSNRESLYLTHQLRSQHEGILVGIGTVLADDPQLTVRECSGPSPQPIVLDSQRRMPATARLCQGDTRQCWVFTSREHAAHSRADVEFIGVDSAGDGLLSLEAVLAELWQRGIRSVMVEGGAQVITGFLRERLADGIVLTVAPVLVGGYKAVGDLGLMRNEQMPRLESPGSARLGEDLVVWGNLRYGEAP